MAVWTIVGVEPHVCPEDLAQFCQGLFDCASRQTFCIFSGKDSFPECCSKGSEESGLHEGLESLEEWVMLVFNSFKVSFPSAPCSRFFVSCFLLNSMCSLFFCKSQVIQKVIDGGSGSMEKILGTCSGKEERIKERGSLSERSCLLLRVSATSLYIPLKCWL